MTRLDSRAPSAYTLLPQAVTGKSETKGSLHAARPRCKADWITSATGKRREYLLHCFGLLSCLCPSGLSDPAVTASLPLVRLQNSPHQLQSPPLARSIRCKLCIIKRSKHLTRFQPICFVCTPPCTRRPCPMQRVGQRISEAMMVRPSLTRDRAAPPPSLSPCGHQCNCTGNPEQRVAR